MRNILIGIDDTDNAESQGTGFLSRKLGSAIEEHGIGNVISISRHQLFVHPDIPYTSKNSSACLWIITEDIGELMEFCCTLVRIESAKGSDAGIAVGYYEDIEKEIIHFGLQAKYKVLSFQEAEALAAHCKISLKELTGNGQGIIGALAATGLRKSGNDGRCIWMKGEDLRNFKGIHRASEITTQTGVDAVVDLKGGIVPYNDRINLGNWVRPVIRNNQILLLTEKVTNNKDYEWKVASKDYIRNISA
jgi:hypothetical protein